MHPSCCGNDKACTPTFLACMLVAYADCANPSNGWWDPKLQVRMCNPKGYSPSNPVVTCGAGPTPCNRPTPAPTAAPQTYAAPETFAAPTYGAPPSRRPEYAAPVSETPFTYGSSSPSRRPDYAAPASDAPFTYGSSSPSRRPSYGRAPRSAEERARIQSAWDYRVARRRTQSPYSNSRPVATASAYSVRPRRQRTEADRSRIQAAWDRRRSSRSRYGARKRPQRSSEDRSRIQAAWDKRRAKRAGGYSATPARPRATASRDYAPAVVEAEPRSRIDLGVPRYQ